MSTRGRKRLFPELAHLPSAEYTRLSAKLRRAARSDEYERFNRAYCRAYRRNEPTPTYAAFRAGTYQEIPLLTPEQLLAHQRAGWVKRRATSLLPNALAG